MKTRKDIMILCAAVAALGVSTAFSNYGGLTEEEKGMIGSYYVPEISDSQPAFELAADGSSVWHGSIPGEISVEIPGKWRLENEELVVENDTEHARICGDRSLLGRISGRIVRKIKGYDGSRLILMNDGLEYAYRRRPLNNI